MRQFHIPGQPKGSPAAGFSKKEKRRLLVLIVGAFVVFAGFLYGMLEKQNLEQEDVSQLPAPETPAPAQVYVPKIDSQRLEELVADAEQEDRVVLEGPAVAELLAEARKLTPKQFRALGEEELDAARVERILAHPGANRGKAFFARGRVDALRERTRDGETQYIGRLELDDESVCYFLTLGLEDAPEDGAYVRVDGLFLKAYAEEDQLEPGTWIDGPLLVGPKAIRSYRSLGEVTSLPVGMFDDVEDADIHTEGATKIVTETPFEPLWTLMAYARDAAPDAVDWDAAPELDKDLLQDLIADPQKWRLQPIRIPISRVQDGRVIRAEENPARIEEYTQGWMGNWNWGYVVRFLYPRPNRELHLRDYAYGRGYFLHDFAYESAGRGLRVAPVMVLTELHRYVPPKPALWGILGKVFLISAVALITLFIVLVARQQRQSKRLEEDLIRRRRARRERQGRGSLADPAQS